ncbi:DUF2188 domain-containing protein [Paenarthrobacter ureafaciens]|uniref:DUF2188 domain-containing protein n=1 Tax=Paenarthrobacter ureafaciens TaxID=37931 RepID=UPI0009AF2134|nr:DUF2188 domain-containing protein [Paenarthrobacter ureafaciens]GLU58588.1 hypothetical protein Pure01_11010 [Paenarthrobacter ureafaciens]GLU61833.1 hypothetical protein Pure02_00830 [Paenarthrobacter ureafaciens]GLU66107.1 hypothetical protein Pure03_00830 [Paenarthrobacter ureafaciens]GLU71569.1 hypothetical protein Pure04_12840 [Paenarthrobacter ureafaciens]GLU74644.1 hypothetical protein Pure05_00840 [Paenarthrobacter ureafaciens]
MPDYNVYKKGDKWVGEKEGASRASVTGDTQAEVYRETRDLSQRNGGGEISVHGVNGQIREKNTIAPAKDPRKTKG